MSYDEEQTKRSRVVIETPTSRREVVQQQTVRYPEERRGYSAGVLAAVALTAIAATAIIFLFLMNSGEDEPSTNVNVRATLPTQPTPLAALPPVTVQTPMTMPTPATIIVQQPPPMTTTMPPVVVQQPATTAPPPATTTAPPSSTTAAAPPVAADPNDDNTLQEKIDDAFAADAEVTNATIETRVINGKVFLRGTVSSDALKQKAEKLAYAVKGVRSVENRIIVSP
jgi:hypothetical protein